MPCQLPAFTCQSAGCHTRRARRVQLFDDVRQEQYLRCFKADGLGDALVRLRFTLGPRCGVEIALNNGDKSPASEQPKISFCACIEPEE